MSEIKIQEEETQKPENKEEVVAEEKAMVETVNTSSTEEKEKEEIKEDKPVSSNARTMIILTHILPLVTSFIIPVLGNILSPLIILLITEEEIVKKHSKASLNWQLSLSIYLIVSSILMFLLIGFLIFPIVIVVGIIFPIMAAIKSNENPNIVWQYPLSIKFFS